MYSMVPMDGKRLSTHGRILQRGDRSDSSGLRGEVTLSFVTWISSIVADVDTVVHNPFSRDTGFFR